MLVMEGSGDELDGLVVNARDPQGVLVGSAVEHGLTAGAVVSIVQNVGLQDGHLGLVGGDELDVRLGGAGVDSGELGQAQLVADGGDERVANGMK